MTEGEYIRIEDLEAWLRGTLRDIEGRPDDEIVEGQWGTEAEGEPPLTVRQVRERNLEALARIEHERATGTGPFARPPEPTLALAVLVFDEPSACKRCGTPTVYGVRFETFADPATGEPEGERIWHTCIPCLHSFIDGIATNPDALARAERT